MENNKLEIKRYLNQLEFWGDLTDSEKDLLVSRSKLVKYNKGANIHRGALDCIGTMFVKSGQLRVYILSEDGRDVTLCRLFNTDVSILSATCALDAVSFEVYIDAEEDSEICLTDVSAIKRIINANISVRCRLYEMASARLSDMLWRLQQILFLSADKRLAIFLLEEAEKEDSDEIHLTHEQIARYMGTAREVVTRLVKYFSQEGLVRTARGRIKLLQPKILQELASVV